MSKTFARWATGVVVLAVAVIAATVSYVHIESLALANGYAIGTARLLPFSADGLIVASSLSLATGGRTALARTGLVLGVLATVAANIAFGAGFGLTGAVVNSWPAISFVVSSEILVGMLRARPVAGAGTTVEPEAETTSAPVGVETGAETSAMETTPSAPVESPTVAAGAAPTRTTSTRATRRTTVKGQPSPEKVFATEIKAGMVPTIRAIKERCHVGTDRARAIRAQLLASIGSQAELPEIA